MGRLLLQLLKLPETTNAARLVSFGDNGSGSQDRAAMKAAQVLFMSRQPAPGLLLAWQSHEAHECCPAREHSSAKVAACQIHLVAP